MTSLIAILRKWRPATDAAARELDGGPDSAAAKASGGSDAKMFRRREAPGVFMDVGNFA